MCQSGCWLVQRVVRESGVAVVGQSVTASRYVDCVVPCKSVEVEERLGLCRAPYPCGRIRRKRKLCRVKAVRTMAMARFAPKPCGCIGRERRLCRAKAMQTNRTGAKALPCQSCADESDRSEGFVVSKPCRRIGRKRRLCHVKAVRSMAMARFVPKLCGRWLWLGRAKAVRNEWTGAKALPCQSRVDRSESFTVSKPCGRADRPGGQG